MRVPGYCEKCHRPRQVSVSGAALARLAAGSAAIGICRECEDAEQKARDERNPRMHRTFYVVDVRTGRIANRVRCAHKETAEKVRDRMRDPRYLRVVPETAVTDEQVAEYEATAVAP